jgi:hypothetical protein
MRMARRCGLIATLVALPACASKLQASTDEVEQDAAADEDADSDLPRRSGEFRHSPKRDGSIVTLVDATVETEWQQLDLDTGRQAEGETDWDIAFSRFRIRTNGGVTGPGGVQVAALEGPSFEDVTRAPDEGFAADREDSVGDGGDSDGDPDNVFNSGAEDWYDYNVMTHELSPKDVTYVIASSEQRFYKLRIVDYYDSAGTPAQLKFLWAEIEAPNSGWPPAASGGDEAAAE